MKRIAIVYGAFHEAPVKRMLEIVRAAATEKKVKILTEVQVPGSLEKPLAIKRLLKNDKVDAVVVLGVIEKGETSHGFVMGQAVIQTLINLQLEFMKPIGIGILGPDIELHQIESRIQPNALAAFNAAYSMLSPVSVK